MHGLTTPLTRTRKDSFYQKYKFFEIEIFIRPNLPVTINNLEALNGCHVTTRVPPQDTQSDCVKSHGKSCA